MISNSQLFHSLFPVKLPFYVTNNAAHKQKVLITYTFIYINKITVSFIHKYFLCYKYIVIYLQKLILVIK